MRFAAYIVPCGRLPNVSQCEDYKGKNTIDGELVPVVGPLHVNLILPQPGLSIAWPCLSSEALQLNEATLTDIFLELPRTPGAL